MNKRQYLIESIQAGAYKRKAWILSVFTVVKHRPDREPYPYQLVRSKDEQDDHVYFLDPNHDMQPVKLEEASWRHPIYHFDDRITLSPGELPNVTTKIETRVGNVLYNAMCIIYAFHDKFPFVTGKVKAEKVEAAIAVKLKDDPPADQERSKDVYYVDELLRYCEGMGALAGLTQINSPGASERSMTIDPIVLKRKKELLEQYKDQLHDPAIISRIETELTDLDRSTFKGDPAEHFYVKSKTFDVQRKRAFIMFGIETGFGDQSRGANLIQPSLLDGVDMTNMPGWVDSVRAGSYNRGHETALGGESVKYFYRIFQNTRVAEPDCGVQTGMSWSITEDNYRAFAGLHLAGVSGKSKDPEVNAEASRLTEERLRGLIGKTVSIRSPVMCQTEGSSFCARCVGDGLAANPTGLHISISDVGSNFMYAFMQATHGKALRTSVYHPAISIT